MRSCTSDLISTIAGGEKVRGGLDGRVRGGRRPSMALHASKVRLRGILSMKAAFHASCCMWKWMDDLHYLRLLLTALCLRSPVMIVVARSSPQCPASSPRYYPLSISTLTDRPPPCLRMKMFTAAAPLGFWAPSPPPVAQQVAPTPYPVPPPGAPYSSWPTPSPCLESRR